MRISGSYLTAKQVAEFRRNWQRVEEKGKVAPVKDNFTKESDKFFRRKSLSHK
jgi:hypothetical protein